MGIGFVEREVTMSNSERRILILQKRNNIDILEREILKLISECHHEIVNHNKGAVCEVCEKDFGWYCPKSPEHYCEYSESRDYCDYCGEPEERK